MVPRVVRKPVTSRDRLSPIRAGLGAGEGLRYQSSGRKKRLAPVCLFIIPGRGRPRPTGHQGFVGCLSPANRRGRMWNPVRVRMRVVVLPSQGALRDPGLGCATPSAWDDPIASSFQRPFCRARARIARAAYPADLGGDGRGVRGFPGVRRLKEFFAAEKPIALSASSNIRASAGRACMTMPER